MQKVFFVTNIFPIYREQLWKKIILNQNFDITFIFSKNNPSGIKEVCLNSFDKSYQKSFKIVRGYWLFNRVLIWQFGVLRQCFFSKFDSIIFLGEMYIFSNWLGAIFCRLRGKKVIFWGHGFYGNEGFIKKKIRFIFYSLAHKHILYEKRGKNLMIKNGFKKTNLYVIYNSLDYDLQTDLFNKLNNGLKNPIPLFKNNNIPRFIYCGRLIKSKKVNLLIEAINQLNANNIPCNLLIVGDGYDRKNLEGMANEKLFNKNIIFYGDCYNELILGDLIYRSTFLVSPGNVGLSAIHSLSYGTPVITHDNFNNQMPEVEVIESGYNGYFFEENNLESLKTTLIKSIQLPKLSKIDCRSKIETFYNYKFQIKLLEKLIL